MISLDTETTGLDIRHGARPFLVTTYDKSGENTWWEWDVDPLTRGVKAPHKDLQEIQQVIDDADKLILQNPKFDYQALQALYDGKLRWDWSKIYDTLLAGHLLASNQPHDLTTMVMVYCGINVQPYEDAVEKATKKARSMVSAKGSTYQDWRIAKKDLPEMPSAKEKTWKYDIWLPRTIAIEEDYPLDHDWRHVCGAYANSDSASTMLLFKEQEILLKKRGLWRIYEERLKVLPIVVEMEEIGVTLSRERLEELVGIYERESLSAGQICTNVAKSYGFDLSLPKTGANKSLRTFVFDVMKLEPQKRSKKTGEPSLDKDCLEAYETLLPSKNKAYHFVKNLRAKRKRDTALTYMAGYKRFWLSETMCDYETNCGYASKEWYRLHPSLNPTGTDTLRWSSNNPNSQNVSKKEGFNLRYPFGPAPGREWWSCDAKNIELRIPAYEAGEKEMIALFEKPDEPPYFGSNHLLIFDILHPDKWDRKDPEGLLKAKKQYASSWYQWVKNGNFATQYGAVIESGTADRAYHVKGAQKRVQERFRRIKELNERMVAMAKEQGFVETMPDKTVDPNRGYPLQCGRNKWGGVLETTPLNYHVQGTAMWWMMKAMIRCYAFLQKINATRKSSRRIYMIMQGHDELVFDFPRVPNHSNLGLVHWLMTLMEKGGDDIGIPTPVSCEYHPNNWSEGEAM